MFGSAKAKDVCSSDTWVNEESSEDKRGLGDEAKNVLKGLVQNAKELRL